MAGHINLSWDSQSNKKLLKVWTLCVAGYAKDATVGTCHRTSNGQEHKIIWRAGPEQDTIFYLRVTACREQGSHCHDEWLAWVASRGQWTSYSKSFVSKVLGANYNRANNFHPLADELITDKFAMHWQEVTFEPTSNAHASVDYQESVVLHRPDNNKTKSSCLLTLDMGTTVPNCNHGNKFVYVLCRSSDALLHNTK